ncbi:S49 family peptidase [Marinobacter flavimaris]|jgi:signal peptide peptidase SppA|uniref:S49 family peptidase n=1 Tax=Marinobacter flavimaris TaxID=262076 RepID=UPI00386B628D|tara:strand:+ start:3961 stop:4830 length:870 start_codon:yes stop_codon:yes gene_type:complete
MFNSDMLWLMHPQAVAQLQAKIQMAIRVGAGPADDAEREGLPVTRRGNTAIIPITGPMVKAENWFTRWLGMSSTLAIRAAINAAVADDSVENIVLLIDSPGGSTAALSELGDTVALAKEQKPIISQVDSMAASAAYYVAAQTTKIYAGRMDLVGSIGVRMTLYDYSKAFESAGIKAIPIDTGEFKSAGEMGTEITEAQIAEFQKIVDGYFDDFRQAVMNGRGLSQKQFDAVADGRMFFATEAVELGLIDGIQNSETTLSSLIQVRPGRRTSNARRRLAAETADLPSQIC